MDKRRVWTNVRVSGQEGFSRQLAVAAAYQSLPVGAYTVTARAASSGGDTYAPNFETRTVTLSANGGETVAVVYSRQAQGGGTGSLAVTVSGLSGQVADVVVSGPGGYNQTMSASGTLQNLTPGTYSVAARSVSGDFSTYAPTPETQNVSVAVGATARATVTYAVQPGGLEVTVTGLPSGVNADIAVSGPGGFSQVLSRTTTLSSLAPGVYTVTAANVSQGDNTYVPDPSSRQRTVRSGSSSATIVAYALQEPDKGSLSVEVEGLPEGVNAIVTVSGPDNFSQSLTESRTLRNLAPGAYIISASNVTGAGGNVYVPGASQTREVEANRTATARVLYTPEAGRLRVAVSGLPSGQNAAVTVSGPGGFSRTLTASQTLSDLVPGAYTVAAADVMDDIRTYQPTPRTSPVTVTSNRTAEASVAYALQPGSLSVAVSGLPDGTNASVTVSGLGGFSQALTGSQTLSGLTPGEYTVTAQNVAVGSDTYRPAPATQTKVVASGSSESVPVVYSVLPVAVLSVADSLELETTPGAAKDGELLIRNTGSAALEYTVTKDAEWLELTGGASGTVAPDGEATLALRATCPATPGSLSAPLTFTSNAPAIPTKEVVVWLECVAPPTIVITAPTAREFEDTEEVTFTATAQDYRGQDLSSAIVWRVGERELGRGPSVKTRFDIGTQNVVASVTDAGGRTNQASAALQIRFCINPVVSGTVRKIPDRALENSIRRALNKQSSNLTCEDMARLTNLELYRWNDGAVRSLQGLHYAANLTYLYGYNQVVSDLTPLAKLTKLTSLNFDYSRISDLKPLKSLTELTSLNLYNNQIADVTPLRNLTKLTQLYLSNNDITDASALSGLTNLTNLSLDSNQLTAIPDLSGMSRLSSVGFSSNQLEDISGLANAPSLTSVSLSGNRIVNLSALQGLTQLQGIYLSNNLIKDISPLRNNTGIGRSLGWYSISLEGNCLDLRNNTQASQDVQFLRSQPRTSVYVWNQTPTAARCQ